MQVEDEVLPRLACLQENQDFEDFLIPNCQYTAMPYSEELQGPIDSQHPTIKDGPEYFSVIFGEVHIIKLTSML